MIRINLIRGKRKKGKEINFDFLYLLVPLAVLAGVFFFHQTQTARLEQLGTDIQKAEATIRFSGGEVFADCTDGDMYAAIDLLIDKLDRQILKHKEKIKSHK